MPQAKTRCQCRLASRNIWWYAQNYSRRRRVFHLSGPARLISIRCSSSSSPSVPFSRYDIQFWPVVLPPLSSDYRGSVKHCRSWFEETFPKMNMISWEITAAVWQFHTPHRQILGRNSVFHASEESGFCITYRGCCSMCDCVIMGHVPILNIILKSGWMKHVIT